MQKLILGTAQFGQQQYGIKKDTIPDLKEIEKIAQVAWAGGIRIIHTSWQYSVPNIDVFDDFIRIHKDRYNPRLFNFRDMQGWSLYHPLELPNTDGYDIIQCPISIIDNRFLPRVKEAKKKGLQIHARSVFLQGLLLMDEFPVWLPAEVEANIRLFWATSTYLGLERYEAALGWVLGLEDIDHVIVGVNSAEQLKQLLAVEPLQWKYNFSITDENVLDPRKWPK